MGHYTPFIINYVCYSVEAVINSATRSNPMFRSSEKSLVPSAVHHYYVVIAMVFAVLFASSSTVKRYRTEVMGISDSSQANADYGFVIAPALSVTYKVICLSVANF